MQLSWPRDGDERRAIVLRDVPSLAINSTFKHFLSTNSWDVSLSEDLESGASLGEGLGDSHGSC
jgi:hypothetical protein